MISIKHRFHGHASLNYVYRHGKTVRGPLTSIKYVPNDRRTHYRLAIVVSKKVSKSAVVRNRIRRRLYEAFRTLDPPIRQSYDMVLTVFHDSIATMPSNDINKLVYTQVKQTGIIDA